MFGKPLIAPNRLTIASLIKQQDYQTTCMGNGIWLTDETGFTNISHLAVLRLIVTL